MKDEPKYTQSGGGVVLNRDGKVLVVSQHGTSWSLPKGHIEGNEKPIDAAKREIFEESGITDLEYVKDLGDYERNKIAPDGLGEDESERKKIYVFLFKTKEDFLKPVDVENPEARWVSKEEVPELLTHQKDKDFFSGVLEQISNLD